MLQQHDDNHDQPNIHPWVVSVDPDGLHVAIFVAWLKLFGFDFVGWLWDTFGWGDYEDE